jgi:uncharacterized protein YneF (UPF0154 family)
MHEPLGPGLIGDLFFIIWLVLMSGMFVGYFILLVAVWRAMKAHESIASNMANFLRELESRRT